LRWRDERAVRPRSSRSPTFVTLEAPRLSSVSEVRPPTARRPSVVGHLRCPRPVAATSNNSLQARLIERVSTRQCYRVQQQVEAHGAAAELGSYSSSCLRLPHEAIRHRVLSSTGWELHSGVWLHRSRWWCVRAAHCRGGSTGGCRRASRCGFNLLQPPCKRGVAEADVSGYTNNSPSSFSHCCRRTATTRRRPRDPSAYVGCRRPAGGVTRQIQSNRVGCVVGGAFVETTPPAALRLQEPALKDPYGSLLFPSTY
jgi:hypothetical protein